MKIDISELLKNFGNEIRVEEDENVSFPEDDLIITAPVKVNLHLVNVGSSILVTGRLKARVRLNCVRCLKDFEKDFTVEVEEEYGKKPPSSRAKKGEVELKEEDFVFSVESDNTIDLTEAIRQNLMTALPIKPLCRESCKGVEGGKGKKEKSVDPRLSKLKDILNK
jgi:uncharacterized protein